VTSCATRLSIRRDRRMGLNRTRRILVDDLLEFTITHCWEVIAADELLELGIRPGVETFRRSYTSCREIYSRNVEAGQGEKGSLIVAIA